MLALDLSLGASLTLRAMAAGNTDTKNLSETYEIRTPKPFRAADLLAKIRDLTADRDSLPEDVQHESSALRLDPVLEHV